jgi:gamma-glutamyltranspeptidase / glutathione hydrolase
MRPILAAYLVGCLSATPVAAEAAEAAHGMVVTEQRLATEVGFDILKHGGNAVDAAVAIGYAEAVVHPCCGNLGGGGFMVIHRDGKDRFINFRETAPGAATPGMLLDQGGHRIPDSSVFGYRAVAVPGSVLGLETARRRYGRLSRRQVMAPAIRLASDGFVLSAADAELLLRARHLRNDPVAASVFLRPDGSPLQAGDRLVQPDLARTLAAIAAKGPGAFYKGRIPAAVAAAAKAHGGIVTAEDFAHYTVTEAEPLRCTYRGFRILSAPPPSSGGVTLCEILNILEGYDLRALGYRSAAALHVMAEAMRRGFHDRNTTLGDPAFVDNPLHRLLAKSYAAKLRNSILPDRATASSQLPAGMPPQEGMQTTHYSVVDAEGNAVAVTTTLNTYFGAQVMPPGTGFLLNNEMDDFSSGPNIPNIFGLVQGEANAIRPGKRPLSSMTPTLVMKDGKAVLVLGSPGGPRIISVVLQTIINVVDYAMALQEAVDAPRIHQQWLPDQLFAEPGALSADVQQQLEAEGYAVKEIRPFGAAEAIGVEWNDGRRKLTGANDPRSPAGAAAGY